MLSLSERNVTDTANVSFVYWQIACSSFQYSEDLIWQLFVTQVFVVIN